MQDPEHIAGIRYLAWPGNTLELPQEETESVAGKKDTLGYLLQSAAQNRWIEGWKGGFLAKTNLRKSQGKGPLIKKATT